MATDPLLTLMRKIKTENAGRSFPIPNPKGPLSHALALFVLNDPGATEDSGANETGFLDPYLNRDRTAVKSRKLLEVAHIDPAHLRVVVAMGGPAKEVAQRVWRTGDPSTLPRLVETCHPLMRGTGYWQKAARRDAELKRAALLIQGEG